MKRILKAHFLLPEDSSHLAWEERAAGGPSFGGMPVAGWHACHRVACHVTASMTRRNIRSHATKIFTLQADDYAYHGWSWGKGGRIPPTPTAGSCHESGAGGTADIEAFILG